MVHQPDSVRRAQPDRRQLRLALDDGGGSGEATSDDPGAVDEGIAEAPVEPHRPPPEAVVVTVDEPERADLIDDHCGHEVGRVHFDEHRSRAVVATPCSRRAMLRGKGPCREVADVDVRDDPKRGRVERRGSLSALAGRLEDRGFTVRNR